MKKRLLSILLCLVIVLGLIPVSAISDSTGSGTHTHCVCGKSDCGNKSHGGELTWIGIASLREIKGDGNYYLTQSVTIDERWHLFNDENITLCLNGYSIRCRNSVQGDTMYTTILNHGNLTITDCGSSGTIEYYNPNHPGVTVYNRAGTFNLWNGTISGNDSDSGVFNGENFNMYGGRIRNNTNPDTYTGAGVINGGTFNMYGGEITDNTATGKGSSGGVFNRGSATFNMYGGTITDNKGVIAGGVYQIGTMNVSGTATIANNTVDSVEKNVYLRSNEVAINSVNDGLTSGARIGISGIVGNTVINGTTFTTGFFSDDAGCELVNDGAGGLKLAVPAVHNDHCICGGHDTDGCDGTSLTWKGISDLNEIKSNGNYYLKNDIALDDDMWVCLYNVNLCLNGKSVVGGTHKATIGINYNKSLTITDCQETVGKITHREGKGGSGIETYAGAVLTLWNGMITGNTSSGVYNKEATFNMYGGSISENVTGADGGGVLNTEGGTFNLYGGSISKNGTESGGSGGGVKNSSGRFNMYGGSITENTAYLFGGGVYNGSIFNMYGGVISDNIAKSQGGGVYNGRTFTMNGGSITDNKGAIAGGVYNYGTFKLSGTPIIDGNTAGDSVNNVYVKGVITIVSALASGAKVGISGTVGSTVVTGTTKTNGLLSDNTGYELVNDGAGGLKLAVPAVHEDHCICGGHEINGCDGTSLTWKGINDLSEITEAGNYYLKRDVTLDATWVCDFDGVNLCLNGKSIIGADGKDVIRITSRMNMAITDCNETAGKITHNDGGTGRGIFINGIFTLWNGNITGNSWTDTGAGAGVYNFGTFTMNGGTISGNSVSDSSKAGGVYNYYSRDFNLNGGVISNNSAPSGSGVYNDGTITMTGGSISDNTGSSYGGGVYNNGTFVMSGGSISGNTGANNGGGVYSKGTFTLSGGSISGNSVGNYGGGVSNDGTFTMTGGSISDNESGAYGGGIYNSSKLFITGGSVTGNSARYGGGVYNWKTLNITGGSITKNLAAGSLDARGGGINNSTNGTITMSGNPIITGNNKGGKLENGTITGGKTENVYLTSTKTIVVDAAGMSDDASVGITGVRGNTVVTGTTSTTGFFSDETDYYLAPDENGGLMLTRDAKVTGKLLIKAGGSELSESKKTYDGEAVVCTDPVAKINGSVIDGSVFTYVWQIKGEDGTYTTLEDLTGSVGPSDAGDYRLTVTAAKNNEEIASTSWDFTIEKAVLNVTIDVKNKEYDGRTEAEDYTFNVTGNVGDELLYRMSDVCFADANVGNDITVTAKFSVEGEAEKNYIAPETVEGKASITPRSLTVNVTAKDKEYDGTANAEVNAVLDRSRVVENDEVTLVTSGVTAAFDTKNFGTNKQVIISGKYTLEGKDAANYVLILSARLTADINKKELTIENLAVASKTYDGTDRASISGTPTLAGVVKGDDVALVNGMPSFTKSAAGENIAISFTEFTLSGADKDNYTLVQPAGITASINPYISDKSEYSVNSNDWQNTDFTVTAKDEWQLSYSNTADSEWVDILTASEETDSGKMRFYVRNKTSGIISEVITEDYKIDKTAPAGEIRIDKDNWWREFLSTVTFNLFFNNDQTVTVSATDNGSGINTIEYLLSSDDLGIKQLEGMTFNAYEGTFSIKPDTKLIVYVRITDTADNVNYLRSDGIVLDATAPVISGADDGRTYCSSVTLTVTDEYLDAVTLNGKEATLTNGKLTLDEGTYTISAADKAGNRTTINITVNNGHTWGDWTSNGNNTHTRTCEVDGTHAETADCNGGTATCKTKAICDDCHQSYGEFGAHDWDTTAWGYTGADGHAHTCKTEGCTEHSILISHIKDRDAATETEPVKCAECGYIIEDKLGHICANHLTYVEAKVGTCTETGNKAYYRCDCGKLFEDANANTEITDPDSVVIAALDHDWKEATCTEPKTCKRDGCGATEGSALGHSFSTEWSKDETGHWHACTNEGCNEKSDFAEHTPGAEATETDDQTCTECGYIINPSLGHICANHLTAVKAKDAACTEAGNKAYYRCDCGKLYADATASVEITEAQTVVAAVGHDYEWKIDKEAAATEKGIKHEECRVCHDKKEAVEIPATGENNPKTGNGSMMGLCITMLLTSAAGVVTAAYSRRKRSGK